MLFSLYHKDFMYSFCLSLVLETDRPDPGLTEAEIKYVPEQM